MSSLDSLSRVYIICVQDADDIREKNQIPMTNKRAFKRRNGKGNDRPNSSYRAHDLTLEAF